MQEFGNAETPPTTQGNAEEGQVSANRAMTVFDKKELPLDTPVKEPDNTSEVLDPLQPVDTSLSTSLEFNLGP